LGALTPAALLLGMWMAWIPATGAFFPETWYPSLAGAWLVLLVTAVAGGRLLPVTRGVRVALGAFGALVAFNYLSMLWAGSPANALSASNQLLLYLLVAWIFSILPWTAASLSVLLGAWSVGVAIFCGIDLGRATGAASLTQFFADYRYATPLAYPNATAALAVMGMWPALILSSRRELSPWLRGPLLGVAMFLIEFSFLPESRGALVGLAVSALLVLVCASDRIVVLIRLVVLGIGLAVTLPSILDVTGAVNHDRLVGPVLSHAANLLLLTSLVAVSVVMCLPLIEESLASRRAAARALAGRPRHSTWLTPRRFSRHGLLTWGVVATLGIGTAGALAAPAINRLASRVAHQGQTDAQAGTLRLLSTAPEERLDYARVALQLFAQSPIGGVGAGNFGRRYDALRHFSTHSQYTHNLPLRVLSETGIVGFGLLIGLVATLLVGLGRAVLELPGLGRATAVAGLAVSAFFAIHASFDWLDEFPVLAAPALALPLAAIETRRVSAATAALPSRSRLAPALRVGVLVGATAIIALAAIPPYLEVRYTDQALTVYSHQPATAYHDLELAAGANPLSANPLETEGTLAIRQRDWTLARSAFVRADQREELWFAHLELALLDARAGQFTQASSELDRAAALDADDPVIARARQLVGERQRIDPPRFDQLLLQGPERAIYGRQQIR
jgi:hypothetical protein